MHNVSIDQLVAHTVEAYGRVDGVVNVAGIGGAGSLVVFTTSILVSNLSEAAQFLLSRL